MSIVKVKVDCQSLLNKIEYDLDTYRIENTSIDSPKESKIVLDVLSYALKVVRNNLQDLEFDYDDE